MRPEVLPGRPGCCEFLHGPQSGLFGRSGKCGWVGLPKGRKTILDTLRWLFFGTLIFGDYACDRMIAVHLNVCLQSLHQPRRPPAPRGPGRSPGSRLAPPGRKHRRYTITHDRVPNHGATPESLCDSESGPSGIRSRTCLQVAAVPGARKGWEWVRALHQCVRPRHTLAPNTSTQERGLKNNPLINQLRRLLCYQVKIVLTTMCVLCEMKCKHASHEHELQRVHGPVKRICQSCVGKIVNNDDHEDVE